MHMPFAIVPPSTWLFVFAPLALLFAGSFFALVIGSLTLLRSTRDLSRAVAPAAADVPEPEVAFQDDAPAKAA